MHEVFTLAERDVLGLLKKNGAKDWKPIPQKLLGAARQLHSQGFIAHRKTKKGNEYTITLQGLKQVFK